MEQPNIINQINELNTSNQSLFSQSFPWGEIPYLTLGKKCLKISYKRPAPLKDVELNLDLVLEDLQIALPYFRGKLLKTDHEEGIQSFYFSLEQILSQVDRWVIIEEMFTGGEAIESQSYAVFNPASGKFEIVEFIETYQGKALAERALEIIFEDQYYSKNYDSDRFSVGLLDGETEIRDGVTAPLGYFLFQNVEPKANPLRYQSNRFPHNLIKEFIGDYEKPMDYQISLERAEGKEHECVAEFFPSMKEAQKCLWKWSATAPKDQSCHKVYVKIWDENIEIKFRLDLSFSHSDLSPYIKHFNRAHEWQCKECEGKEGTTLEFLSYLARKTSLLNQLLKSN